MATDLTVSWGQGQSTPDVYQCHVGVVVVVVMVVVVVVLILGGGGGIGSRGWCEQLALLL